MSSCPYDSDTDQNGSKKHQQPGDRDGSRQRPTGNGSSRRRKDTDDFNFDDDDEVVDNEYYSFLHVPRTASQEEITAAYKKLSRHYHPDKHLAEERKQQAEVMFAKLKDAYEVLSDPHKRAIYDCLGRKGLQEKGWEIVQRTRTPQEIREEYERLARARTESRLQQRTNPTSRLQMSINATELFERYHHDESLDDVIESSVPTIEVSEINFSQTIEAPITNTDKVILAGNVSTRNGTGSGSVGCTWRRVTSDRFWFELMTSFGSGPTFGGKFYRKLTTHTFVNMSGSIQFTPRGVMPSFNASLGNSLTKTTMAYLTYSTNFRLSSNSSVELALQQEQSGMSTMVVRNGEKYTAMASIQLGIPYTYFTASITNRVAAEVKDMGQTDGSLRLRAAFKAGTFGMLVEYGIERRLTRDSTLGATMRIGVPTGVTLRIKLTRSTQTYIFPLYLADDVLMQPIVYGTVMPLLAWFTFKKLVLDPYEAKKKRLEKENVKEANLVRVAETRKEAKASVDLMMERFKRIRNDEAAKGGFVVVLAVYGKVLSDAGELLPHLEDVVARATFEEEHSTPQELFEGSKETIDVTVPVQCLVENSRLVFFEGNQTKSDLAGFYDPCALLVDERKHLLVRYLYQGHQHQVVIADHEAAKLPRNSHRL